jgi:tetratricopeptide (TPR) repeat protein
MFLAAILAAIHTALFAFVTVAVVRSSDPEAVMGYYFFFRLDYPVSRLYQLVESTNWWIPPIALMPVLGGLLWFLCGFVLQSLFSIRSVSGLRRFGVGLLLLVFVCALPDIYLASLPRWEKHWLQGTSAREANDLSKAIWHVSEAVRLSPKDNSILDGMWDYLGRIYMEQKDYTHAGEAFARALAAAAAKPNLRPVDLLNAYNELAWFYRNTGDKQREEECLLKAIEFNRLVYGADSVQETNCQLRLAEIKD